MADSDDDYMSEKFLMDCSSQEDIRPGLIFNKGVKRTHELLKKKEDIRSKKQKPLKVIEKETREEGLSTAIGIENKGFKLLEKMGFKQGESLGKSNSGLKEPINIVVHQGTSGLGRQKQQQDNLARYKEIKHKRYHEEVKIKTNIFRSSKKEHLRNSILKKDFFKAQKICEELDTRIHRSDPMEDYYWTKETIKKRRKGVMLSDDEDSEDDEFESQITEENLYALINYLRSKHLYCIYCIMTGVNEEDLKENCPGPYRIDHDSEFDFGY